MRDIIHIEDHVPHDVFEAMCWRCGKRWIVVVPAGVNLKDIECPKCHEQGYAFLTGQEISETVEIQGRLKLMALFIP